jgi:tRNA-dihydrouridine synthase B
VNAIKKHLQHSIEWKGEVLGMLEMRRHYANYLKGLPNIKDYRIKLTTLKEAEAIYNLLNEINDVYADVQPEKRKLNISDLAYSCG